MTNRICYGLTALLVIGSCGVGYGMSKDPLGVPLKITGDRRTESNRLVIPRKFLTGLSATSVTNPDDSNARTIIAGLALSLAVVSLAIILIRRNSRTARTAAELVAIGIAGYLVGEMATADIAPPISELPRSWQQVSSNQQQVTIEISEKGDSVELILGTYYRTPSRENEFLDAHVPHDRASAPNTGSEPPETPTAKPEPN